jgi:hypothetical protein
MPRTITTFLLLAVASGCAPDRAQLVAGGLLRPDQLEPLNEVLTGFFAAAEREDSALIGALVTGEEPWLSARELLRDEPELIQAFRRSFVVKASSMMRRDTAGVVYSFRYKDDVEDLGVTYVWDGRRWRVHRIGLPKRI